MNKNNKQILVRDRYGRFTSPHVNIVNGRLYDLNGITVRARKTCQNNFVLVSYHKDLFGIVHPCRLSKISKRKVESYLNNA